MAIKGERGKRWIFVNVATKQYVNASRSLISERKPGHCVEGIMRANSIDQLYIKQISMYFLLPFSNLKKKRRLCLFLFFLTDFRFLSAGRRLRPPLSEHQHHPNRNPQDARQEPDCKEGLQCACRTKVS
jgi:hypothetical protein